MALNKLKFNSLNVTPAAGEAIRFNSSANGLETASAGGSLVKIAATTASSSSSVSFTSGIDSTYKEYIFTFNNIHPASDGQQFFFNMSADGGSNFNVTKTTTYYYIQHAEAGGSEAFAYDDGSDVAQSTGYARIAEAIGGDNDQSTSGYLHLFEPSSTTFSKHYITAFNCVNASDQIITTHSGGYGNTTSAINAVDFKVNSGNIDAGTITMYGVL